ncbi:hypothetical protein BS17DRAFT_121104 [Gyrodon lividus]|nr:hypothetical protein BS17DRAFT_121104 [Gyrodon lividus]
MLHRIQTDRTRSNATALPVSCIITAPGRICALRIFRARRRSYVYRMFDSVHYHRFPSSTTLSYNAELYAHEKDDDGLQRHCRER